MKKILLSLFYLLLGVIGFAQTDWVRTNDPYGGNVIVTNASNGKLYAQSVANINEIYKSVDTGAYWTLIPDLPALGLNDVSVYNTYFVGHAGNFYFKDSIWHKSNDEGNIWTTLNIDSKRFDRLTETDNGSLIAWDTLKNEIYRSSDGGQSWELKATMPITDNFHYVYFIRYSSENMVAYGTSSDTNTIYLSTDGGQIWERTRVSNSYRLQFISPSGALFFNNGGEGVFRMSSLGQPLIKVYSYYTGDGATVLSSGRLIISLSGSSLIYSDNDGLDWAVLQTNSNIVQVLNLGALPEDVIFGKVHDGLRRSSDGGITWDYASFGIRDGSVGDLKFISDSLYFIKTSGCLWKTNDAGQHWELLVQLDETYYGNFDLTSTGGIVSFHNNRVYYSPLGDENFIDISPTQGNYSIHSQVVVNQANNDIYFLFGGALKVSKDLGQSWVTYPDVQNVKSLLFLSSGRIIAISTSKIYYSDNDGVSWSIVDDPFPNQVIGCGKMFLSPNGALFLSPNGYVSGELAPILRSDDQGETWYQISNNPEHAGSADLIFAANGHIYNLQSAGMYLSVNDGHSWQTVPCGDSLFCDDHFITLTPSQRFYRQNDSYNCYISSTSVTEGAYIEGHVKVDADADCSTPDAQTPLKNRIVEAESGTNSYFSSTDPEGHYIFFVDTGDYQVMVQNPSGIWWDYCQDSIAVTLSELFVTDTVDFAAVPLSFCPLMTVNVAIPQLRRCFNNEVYVEYCNQGTEPADSVWVDVMLDPYLSMVSSSQPYEDLGGNTIRFFVGDVPSSECGQFQLTVHVDCDSTVLGQTHCVMAHGFPDTLCTNLPDWSGANIAASVSCLDTMLQFHLKNTGTAPSQVLDFIIIEDDIVLFSGQEMYDINEDVVLDYPANGKTWRIESEQEPGHPFSNLALAFAEGCGGFGSLGYINQFPVNGIQPSWHRMCVENIGAFDPNDKQGFPIGVGSEHNIRPGQAIDYLIRFQNTGTDTAFTVVIRDTLSTFLDPISIRAGASSHAYTWSLSGQGVINFTFNNIMLPDSNVNEPLSHGFVQFNIAPYFDVPLGSVIENNAAIYFDFNEPVITNTTWHTIQKSPLTSSFEPKPKSVTHGLEVWPNPFNERTNIRLEKKTSGTVLLKIYDSRGTRVAEITTIGPDIELNIKHLPSGLYWAEVRDSKGQLLGNGKLVKE